MRRQVNADELADFYRRIGSAVWHLQCLEDVLVNFLTAKIIHERRCAGQTVTESDAQVLLAEKRRITLGPLVESCTSKKIISPQLKQRFEAFTQERHWLVHRSMVESGDDLYASEARDVVFARVATVQAEAVSLKKLVFQDLEVWMEAHGVDTDVAENQAEEALRKLQGL
jgi:hypothetical protein